LQSEGKGKGKAESLTDGLALPVQGWPAPATCTQVKRRGDFASPSPAELCTRFRQSVSRLAYLYPPP
jgi:hypothetical protein